MTSKKLILINESTYYQEPNLIQSFRSDCEVHSVSPSTLSNEFVDSLTLNTTYEQVALFYHFPGTMRIPIFGSDPLVFGSDGIFDPEDEYYYGFPKGTVNFIQRMKHEYGMKTLDLVSCNLNETNFATNVTSLEVDEGIHIRYSTNLTGNTPDGDWVLESDNADIKNVYFTSVIDNWEGLLTSAVTLQDIIDSGATWLVKTTDGSKEIYTIQENITWSGDLDGIAAATDYISLGQDDILDGNNVTIDIDGIANFAGLLTSTYISTDETLIPVVRNLQIEGDIQFTAQNMSICARHLCRSICLSNMEIRGDISSTINVSGIYFSMPFSNTNVLCQLFDCSYKGDLSVQIGWSVMTNTDARVQINRFRHIGNVLNSSHIFFRTTNFNVAQPNFLAENMLFDGGANLTSAAMVTLPRGGGTFRNMYFILKNSDSFQFSQQYHSESSGTQNVLIENLTLIDDDPEQEFIIPFMPATVASTTTLPIIFRNLILLGNCRFSSFGDLPNGLVLQNIYSTSNRADFVSTSSTTTKILLSNIYTNAETNTWVNDSGENYKLITNDTSDYTNNNRITNLTVGTIGNLNSDLVVNSSVIGTALSLTGDGFENVTGDIPLLSAFTVEPPWNNYSSYDDDNVTLLMPFEFSVTEIPEEPEDQITPASNPVCYLKGTMIPMFDGTYKLVEQIQNGDNVTTETGPGEVINVKSLKLMKNESTQPVIVDDTLIVSKNHIVKKDGKCYRAVDVGRPYSIQENEKH